MIRRCLDAASTLPRRCLDAAALLLVASNTYQLAIALARLAGLTAIRDAARFDPAALEAVIREYGQMYDNGPRATNTQEG